MAAASAAYGVPLAVLFSVGLTETGRRGALQPFAMNIDGKPESAASLADALIRFETAKRSGAKFIDVGCMQINHHFHARAFNSLAEMFDPARNVAYAARFLIQLHEREKTWTMAVARYNAGPDNDPAQRRYVCTVISNMVGAGFGRWTPSARAFCR